MRRLILALAAASLAVAAPASADPVAHAVVLDGEFDDVSVTCDTSAYPAAQYPCDFALVVTAGCTDLTTGACTLAVHGSLLADPASSSTGECSFWTDGDWRLTFETFDEGVGSYGVVPRTVVNHGQNGIVTSYIVEITPISRDVPALMAGAVVAGFEFSDLQWDCRTRAGGDPASDFAPDSLPHLAPVGAVLLGRP